MGYPRKKQSFYKEKDCFFLGYPKFFGPSYFEAALVMGSSWNFPSWKKGSEPSLVGLGHFNFQAETKPNQNFGFFFCVFVISELKGKGLETSQKSFSSSYCSNLLFKMIFKIDSEQSIFYSAQKMVSYYYFFIRRIIFGKSLWHFIKEFEQKFYNCWIICQLFQ